MIGAGAENFKNAGCLSAFLLLSRLLLPGPADTLMPVPKQNIMRIISVADPYHFPDPGQTLIQIREKKYQRIYKNVEKTLKSYVLCVSFLVIFCF